MFYEKQPLKNREEYKKMLTIIGQLSNLFSESDCPYLSYRAHENTFCKFLDAENLARSDCSADAKKDRVGVGLKTWMGNDDQKVAEFGRLKKNYAHLTGLDLVKQIAEYRNERIRVTKKLHGLDSMIYHVVKRVPGAMQILEGVFDEIDIPNIELISHMGNENNTYFTDGRHKYHFSSSKNTLYMIFDFLQELDSFEVEILEDPYAFLLNTMKKTTDVIERFAEVKVHKPQLCLRLYSVSKGEKFVAEKSGLNQWNASGRPRDPNELYIPYPKVDRDRDPNFFPPRDTPFNLRLPDGTVIPAKVCQQDNKAIMSNPNSLLGKWLLRDVFELPNRKLVTYNMLEKFGIDSVIFTKNADLDYSVEFSDLGTYENFYGIEDE